jgi:hypothetical protein
MQKDGSLFDSQATTTKESNGRLTMSGATGFERLREEGFRVAQRERANN